MIVTGCSRAGTSLLLSLLYCTVKDVEVVLGESSEGWNDQSKISKNPAAVCQIPNIHRPCIMIRDPRAVITSCIGPRGYFINADFCNNGRDPGVLPTHEAACRYPSTALFRYEHLVSRPDQFQHQLGAYWGLEFKYEFSDWPNFPAGAMKKVGDMYRTKLNSVRPFDKGHDWREHMQRVREHFDAFPGLFNVVRAWGYEPNDDWYQEVVDKTNPGPDGPTTQKRYVARPKGAVIGFRQQ